MGCGASKHAKGQKPKKKKGKKHKPDDEEMYPYGMMGMGMGMGGFGSFGHAAPQPALPTIRDAGFFPPE